MKKYIIIIFGLLFMLYNNAIAISVSDFTPALDKKVNSLKTTKQKVKFLESFSNILTDPTFTNDINARVFEDLREYSMNMLNVFQYQLKEETSKTKTKTSSSSTSKSSNSSKSTSQKYSYTNLPTLSDNFDNIDEEEIREAVLGRHNDERDNVGSQNYTYNIKLEGSAMIWANQLANSGKTSNLHVRNKSDGTYNYTSILNRFSDLGIKFPASVKGAASFSESVGYGYFRCSSSNCTQSIINAIKKTWTNLILAEKSYNGDHYRAAIMNHFTQMGIGFAVDEENNRYYVVLHYGTNFN